MSSLAGAGVLGMLGTAMTIGATIYFGGPCLGGLFTKVLPYGADWEKPVGVSQTVCAAFSGAGSDIYSNIWGKQVQGRVAGTIPITGRGGNMSNGQQQTNNDLTGGHNSPYNEVIPLDRNLQIEMWRRANPNAPADATPWNQDGGWNVPMVDNMSYQQYNIMGGASQQPQYRQCAGPADTNCDGAISLGELTEGGN